ncbi:MAG TPA: hypothetical protein VK446_01115 [Methylocystis sp.]|nr:hypothetical protein [Methylocystis sp.]
MLDGFFAGGGAFGLARLAKTVALAAIFGVLLANAFAGLAERGGLPRLTIEWPNEATTKAAQRNEVVTTYRSVGLDGVTTSSIRTRTSVEPAALHEARGSAPCGESYP